MRTVLSALALCFLAPAAAWAQPAPAPTVLGDPATARQRLQRATVSVREGSSERARGVVLAGDGRIVTALAAVAGVRDLRVVYPDGRMVRARVSAVDTAWGLAVLDGTGARWTEGIELAERDGRSGDAASWVPAAGARPVAGTLARRRSFVGTDGALLRDAWEISPVAPRSAAGSGVVHARTATLLGVLVAPAGDVAATGAEGLFAVPIAVIRVALRRAAENARPWLGIVTREVRIGEDPMLAAGGLRVIDVQAGSPAQRAGITAGERGDVVVSVDGRRVSRLDDLGAAMEGRRPGDTVVLQVMRRNATVDVPVTLDALPAR
jgi:S1-C subfamily serine protease